MRWASTAWLFLLWLIPIGVVVAILAARARARVEARLGAPTALRRLAGDAGAGARALRTALLLAALAAGVVGLARPQSGFRLTGVASRGADVLLAVDLSQSMAARDLAPDRLGAARREIRTLLEALEGSRIGLVAFSGTARVLSPLSTDREGLTSLLETARVGDLSIAGSDLGAGLQAAARLLRRPGEHPRAIVVLSDGEDFGGGLGSGLEAARRSGARVFAIGTGTPQGGTIPIVDSTGAIRDLKRDDTGGVVITRLDEGALRDLARRGGGQYARSDGTGRAAERLADPIRSTGAYEARGRSMKAYDERYPWLAAMAGLLLAAERWVPRRRRT